MGDSFSLPSQAFFQNILLGRVQWLQVFSIQYMFWPIFHKLCPRARLERNEVLRSDLLLQIVLSDDTEEASLYLLN